MRDLLTGGRLVLVGVIAFTLVSFAEEKLPDPTKPAEASADKAKDSKAPVTAVEEQHLGEIVVVAARAEQEVDKSPQAVGVVTQEEIQKRQPRTAFQYLWQEPGVYLSQANESFRFPIIRGRREDDLVYLRDGTRQISFQTLDFPIGLIERVEYIRGPGGVQYGSNAIGGVINVVTKKMDTFTEKPTVSGEVFGQYGSARNELTEYGDVRVSTKYISGLIGATHSEFGDYHGPREGKIENSGAFRTTNWYANLAIQPAKGHVLRMEYIGAGKDDQIFYGQSKRNPSGVVNNQLEYEDRDMTKIDYTGEDIAPFLSQVKSYFFYNTNDRFSLGTLETATVRNVTETVVSQDYLGAGMQAVSPLPIGKEGENRLIYGMDYRIDDIAQPRHLRTRTFATNDVTRNRIAGSIPHSKYFVYDGFLLGEFKPHERLSLSAGIRYETTEFKSDPRPIDAINPFTVDTLTLEKTWNSVVYSAGAVVKATDELSFATNVGTGFRVPGPFELVLTAVQGNVSGVSTIPSTTLEPVESTTIDFSTRYKSKRASFTVTGYYTELEKLINFVNTNITIDIPGVGVVPTRRNENASQGYIYGVEADANVKLVKGWSLFGNFTYTRGQNTEQDVPLRSIPPAFGLIGGRWESEDSRWWAETFVNFTARFTRPSPEDKAQQAFSKDPGFGSPNTTTNPPLRSGFEIPGYGVWNIRGGGEIYKKGTRSLSFTVTLENILNHHYRPPFAEVPEAPGTSATVSLLFKF